MATTPTLAHFSALRHATFPRFSFETNPKGKRRSAHVSASLPQTRRSFSSIALFLFHPNYAYASSIFDKYVKRKKLEPLEAYVPAILLTQSQFKDLEKTFEGDQPEFAASRSLLRSGPAGSLRVNIRAVAQYASEDGRGKVAIDAVNRCLGSLEELDSLLLHASRNDPTAKVESMKAKINVALGALDSLLQTVPAAVLDKGKAIADAYRTASTPDDGKSEELDPDLKQLEELL